MKLDKIGFAMVVAFVSELQQREGLDGHDINRLDELIDIEVPDQNIMSAINPLDIDYLMALMAEGTRKIEAIRCHRKITGYCLKDSKDAVEKYWQPKEID